MDLFESQRRNNLLGGLLLVSIAGYVLCRAVDRIYKLHFHPLAKFPGPKEACLSMNWLLQISKDGNPELVFEKLHEKYDSRAIRISPNELHLDDVKLYKTIYNQNTTYMKDEVFYAAFDLPHTAFGEHLPNIHKEARRRLNPFFSRRAIGQLEPFLIGKITDLGRRLDSQSSPYNIFNAVRCTTIDIISQYCAGKSLGQLEKSDEGFNTYFLYAFDSLGAAIWEFMYRPIFRKFVMSIPASVAKAVSEESRLMSALYDACRAAAVEYKRSPPKSSHAVVFSNLTDLGEQKMGTEAAELLIAGSDTTAYSLAMGIFQIARSARIKKRLVEALDAVVADAESLPSLVDLEGIEYLNASVREAVRFAMAVPGRLPRLVPHGDTPLVVDGRVVPAGSVIGMSAYTMNFSKELWGDDAATFNPDRWLGERGKALDANMCSFSKGIRSCLGQNLAYAEIHLIIAYLFRKYDVNLVDKEAKMESLDVFVTAVASHAVMVNLQRREPSTS
ncbi:cytochrome P450 [Colletotrichum zoysiae]|uniref:Cytochrome P450 n=1 Tax=Colletotrichum zoysiae TaxID=1216348 RepID=A0AAD9HW02_9PEZI|nr:cytochrome P450 [Colletotrichum zoysiae]